MQNHLKGKDRKLLLQAELKVTDDLETLSRVRAFVREICQDFLYPPVEEKSVGQLELAANEALSNIILHACEGRANQEILVEVTVGAEQIRIRIFHPGKDFHPGPFASPALDGSRDHGFGLYIISQCVDDVRYFHHEKGNGIQLVKKRTGRKSSNALAGA